jgi:hypothetical protein
MVCLVWVGMGICSGAISSENEALLVVSMLVDAVVPRLLVSFFLAGEARLLKSDVGWPPGL